MGGAPCHTASGPPLRRSSWSLSCRSWLWAGRNPRTGRPSARSPPGSPSTPSSTASTTTTSSPTAPWTRSTSGPPTTRTREYEGSLDGITLETWLTLPADQQAERARLAAKQLDYVIRFRQRIESQVQRTRQNQASGWGTQVADVTVVGDCLRKLRTAVGLDPSNPYAWHLYAWFAAAVGDCDRAAGALAGAEQALAQVPAGELAGRAPGRRPGRGVAGPGAGTDGARLPPRGRSRRAGGGPLPGDAAEGPAGRPQRRPGRGLHPSRGPAQDRDPPLSHGLPHQQHRARGQQRRCVGAGRVGLRRALDQGPVLDPGRRTGHGDQGLRFLPHRRSLSRGPPLLERRRHDLRADRSSQVGPRGLGPGAGRAAVRALLPLQALRAGMWVG